MKTLQWNVVFLCLLLSACLNSDNSSVTASRTDTNENGPPVIVDPPLETVVAMAVATVAVIRTCLIPLNFVQRRRSEI